MWVVCVVCMSCVCECVCVARPRCHLLCWLWLRIEHRVASDACISQLLSLNLYGSLELNWERRVELAKLLTEGFIVGFIRFEYLECNCIPEPADSDWLPSPLPSTQYSHLENKNAAWFQLSMRLIGKLTLVAWVPHSTLQYPITHYPIAKRPKRDQIGSHTYNPLVNNRAPPHPQGCVVNPLLLTLLSCESVVFGWHRHQLCRVVLS